MKRDEIIKEAAKEVRISASVCDGIFEAILNTIKTKLVEGYDITIKDFGTFYLQHRKSKIGQDMIKGVPVVIPQRYQLKFKPSLDLKNNIKELKEKKSLEKTRSKEPNQKISKRQLPIN